MKTLKIRKENDKLILELTYAEFEWAGIEEFIVDIQLVRYDGTVNTFAQNALFEKNHIEFLSAYHFLQHQRWRNHFL